MMKIAFCGAPCSGKTTTAQNFVSMFRFKNQNIKVELIDEYARWFVINYGKPTIFDQYLIAHRQIDKEKQNSFGDILVTDSPAFLALIYSYDLINWENKKEINCLRETEGILTNNLHSYDFIFYLSPKLNNPNDGARIHKDDFVLDKIDKTIKSFMIMNKINFIEINGSLQECVEKSYDKTIEKICQ